MEIVRFLLSWYLDTFVMSFLLVMPSSTFSQLWQSPLAQRVESSAWQTAPQLRPRPQVAVVGVCHRLQHVTTIVSLLKVVV